MIKVFGSLTMIILLLSCSVEKNEKVDLKKETDKITKVLDRLHNAENTKDTLGLINLLDDKALILGHNYNNRQDDIWNKVQFKNYISHWFPTLDSKPPKIIQVESRTVEILDGGQTAMAIEHFQMDRIRLMTRHVAILVKKDTSWFFSLSSYDYAPFDNQMIKIWESIGEDGILDSIKNKKTK